MYYDDCARLLSNPPLNQVRRVAAAVLCCAVLCCAVLCCADSIDAQPGAARRGAAAVLCCALLCCAVL